MLSMWNSPGVSSTILARVLSDIPIILSRIPAIAFSETPARFSSKLTPRVLSEPKRFLAGIHPEFKIMLLLITLFRIYTVFL